MNKLLLLRLNARGKTQSNNLLRNSHTQLVFDEKLICVNVCDLISFLKICHLSLYDFYVMSHCNFSLNRCSEMAYVKLTL